ncbi:hypothetical protein CVT24_009113 [Panaeolus cyanescens]|uniref:DUF202 domain-containing protein n=1 Tax=Panaeolus cyanescens TaxID=181874 RepID=A0A409VAM5_9AGAR|nr:hypothetical protein CVT24_009113 [Panaeolus cyanescens]
MTSRNTLPSEHSQSDTLVASEPSASDLNNTSSLIKRFLSPFSASALASLPRVRRPERYLRADAIPNTESNAEGERPTVRDYHSINLPPQVRVPKKIPTSIKVEGKVWFANERTWVSWLNISILLATLALGLFNASKDDIAQTFAFVYALISVCTLIYGYVLYQHRISMIRRRDPGHFDALAGPVVLSIALFTAVLANFVIRVPLPAFVPQLSVPLAQHVVMKFAGMHFMIHVKAPCAPQVMENCDNPRPAIPYRMPGRVITVITTGALLDPMMHITHVDDVVWHAR